MLTLAFLPMNAPAALAQDTAAEVVRRREQERIAGKRAVGNKHPERGEVAVAGFGLVWTGAISPH
jgi:hypothetical protein